MLRLRSALAALLVLGAALFPAAAQAHFGMLIPDQSIVSAKKRTLDLWLSFSHPFEMVGMDLVKPKRFFAVHEGETTDLSPLLKPAEVMGHPAWTAAYAVNRPGMHIFAFEPQPYPEPAEDNHIIHYTKTVVSAFDQGEGWDVAVGLPTEIVPLTRPWGNYAGNLFTGRVLVDGKPAPGVRVEVEFYNKDGKAAPSDAFITQEVLADENGVFSFACPWKGWWGFAALTDAAYRIEGKAVELGAVLWIEMK